MFLCGVKRCFLRGVIRVSMNFTQGVGLENTGHQGCFALNRVLAEGLVPRDQANPKPKS